MDNMSKRYLKVDFKSFFKQLLNLMIAFQLAVYPFVSTANSPSLTQKERQNLKHAREFNKKHVQSLRDFIFNSEENNTDHYKNHPLDVFGLLKQEVPYKSSRLSKQEERLNQFQTQLKETKEQLEGLKNFNASLNLEEAQGQAQSEQVIEENIKIGTNLDHLENQIEKEEDRISRQSIKVEKLKSKKLKDRVQAKHLFVEIFEDTKENTTELSAENLKAVLSHPSQNSIAPLVLEDNQSKFKGSVYTNNSEKPVSFRLSYKGQTLNSFPQNIEWIAFFDRFLVFLESVKISDTKALLSFIDLKYFEPAIGRTALPLFHIPLHFQKTALNKEDLLSPNLNLTADNQLQLGALSLSLGQLDYLSQLQQLSFNVTVSLLDPESSQMSQKYLKEIVDNFEQSAKEFSGLKEPQAQSISLDTKQLILRFLENRRQIGSSEDISGNYGKHNKALNNLSLLKEENNIVNEFKDSLRADKNFQTAVKTTARQMDEQKRFYSRFFLFLNHISRSQPLGAPKIEKALGLIANSVSLENDSIKNRFSAFKSALSHALYKPSKHRALTTGVLVGAGMTASPEFAYYSLTALDAMGRWFSNWGELFTITAKESFEWVSADGLYNAYIKGDKFSHLITGVSALFGIGLGSIGILHLGANFYDLGKHFISRKGKIHQKEVSGLLNQLKNAKTEFIDYVSQNRADFIHNLSNAEKKKLGISIVIKLGFNQVESRQLLKTASNLDSFYSILQSNKKTALEITAKKEDQQIDLKLESLKGSNTKLKDNQISLSLAHNGSEVTKIFTLKEGDLKQLLDPEASKINSDLSLNIELSKKNSHISGSLQNADFSMQENDRLNKILTKIELDTKKTLLSSDDFLSQQKIKSLNKALAHLLLGYSSWAKTFRFLGLSWNWFFFSRSMYLSPITLVKILWYSQYFKTIHKDSHSATVFNGGLENHLSRLLSRITHKEVSFKKMKEFENQIIEIEKMFLKEVSAQAYLKLAELSGKSSTNTNTLSKGLGLKTQDIKNKRLRAFYGIYKRELFQAVIQDYLLDLTDSKGGHKPSGELLKIQSLKKFVADESVLIKKPSQKEIRQRVERVSQERQISQKSLQAVDSLAVGFLKRFVTKREEASQKALDPNRNLQMERFGTAKKLLNEPEALARAVRQQLVYFTIDKPIELFFTFLFLAAADQGILQILHDQPFTEEAWFHLSRYAIWSGFFAGLVIEIFAGTWYKVQIDARLDETQGFDVLPSQKDVNKKWGAVKWIYKQFYAEDNSLKTNYIYSWRIILANLPAALVTYTIVWGLTLGRFDLDVFTAGYLMLLLPFMGLTHKIENTFEKSANWSLKNLIANGLDLKGKDNHFLSHPVVQEIKMNESSKLRRKFNIWLALVYNNPLGNMADILMNTYNSLGSRGFSRVFFAGSLPTEYWVNFMDFLENKNILSSDFAEKCKSIFTNNRTDL